MRKIAEVFEQVDQQIKQAFVPNPAVMQQQQGQPQGQSQPQGQGQPGPGEQKLVQLLQQLPLQAMQQIVPQLQQLEQLPPDQRDQVAGQIADQLAGSAGGEQGGGAPTAGGEVPQGTAPPTDLENSTVTLRIRDLLDLVSNGKATQSQLKVQDHVQKQQFRQQQFEQKAQRQQQQQAQKDEEQAKAQQAEQNLMMSGGVYPQQPQQ